MFKNKEELEVEPNLHIYVHIFKNSRTTISSQ